MLITMQPDSSAGDHESVRMSLRMRGLECHSISSSGTAAIAVTAGKVTPELAAELGLLNGVAHVRSTARPYLLAQRAARPEGTIVNVSGVRIGGDEPVIMAGPCVVESLEATIAAAQAVRRAGATMLRGGAFKPRTSPYSFQGLGEEGLRILAVARDLTGLPVVTEVMEPEQVDVVAAYADMLQIGARNMANFPLLRRAAASGKPILLKRGFSATIEEWLMSAEYILAGGNDRVVLCERGIRAFDNSTRFTLDLNAVPLVRDLSHLPVIVDPSHGTGRRDLVERMSMAGIAAGAHGLILEVHPDPDSALCDSAQTITPATLASIVSRTHLLTAALNPLAEPMIPLAAD
ncbi:MAG: 3-deoxy-7-phosphoheptulonate synthase [Chloroflexi bacterium]|nr:MAG: 3-deoxy-7-phosphoheptulonate synthase [Chloroflexota bacterium]